VISDEEEDSNGPKQEERPSTGEEGRRSEGSPQETSGFMVVQIRSRRGRPSVPVERVPAKDREQVPQTAPETSRILDRLMALPEETQIREFRGEYLDRSDPDDEAIAALTEAFFQNNLNMVVFPLGPVSEAYDTVEDVFFNKALEPSVADFLALNGRTRTGTEFLFYLASQYEFERRTLQALFKARGEAEAYLKKGYRTAEIFEKEQKAFVVKEICGRVDRAMTKRGYASLADVLSRYRLEQARIYQDLIARGGESRNRGLWELGCLYWDNDAFDRAIQTWAGIDVTYSIEPLRAVRDVLSRTSELRLIVARVGTVLDEWACSGTDELLLRLVRFGTWKTRAASQ
jgi:hypothetical protein